MEYLRKFLYSVVIGKNIKETFDQLRNYGIDLLRIN